MPSPPAGPHYRITRVVGQGAFGAVYEGERIGEGLNRKVALKLLHAQHAGHVGVERRLRDEARVLSLIHHRAIVRVDDLVQIDDAWCVVMEFVDGADLGALLELGPLPPRVALQVAEEIASALHAAYGQVGPEGRPLRLVHRDIKPANVRITPQGEVKLLDFGIAKADFGSREAKTMSGGVGTLPYLAAERFAGHDTHQGDVYALGVTLFELLTGVLPGSSAADADRQPPGRQLRAQWAWLQSIEPALAALIARMMAPEVEDRPSGRECARALGELRLKVSGEVLEDWAEVAVPRAALARANVVHTGSDGPESMLQVGQTVGASLILDPATEDPVVAPPRKKPRAFRPLAVAAGAVVSVVVALGVAAVFVFGVSAVMESGGNANSANSTVAKLDTSRVGSAAASPEASVPSTQAAAGTPTTTKGMPTPTDAPPPSSSGNSAGVASGSATSSAPKTGGTPAVPKSSGSTTASSKESSAGSTASPAASTAPSGASTAPSIASVVSSAAPAASGPPSVVGEAAVVPKSSGSSTGTLLVSGATRVVLSGSAGGRSPGEVPPGSYSASVSFGAETQIELSGIGVEAGKTTRVRCSAQFATCKVGLPE